MTTLLFTMSTITGVEDFSVPIYSEQELMLMTQQQLLTHINELYQINVSVQHELEEKAKLHADAEARYDAKKKEFAESAYNYMTDIGIFMSNRYVTLYFACTNYFVVF